MNRLMRTSSASLTNLTRTLLQRIFIHAKRVSDRCWTDKRNKKTTGALTYSSHFPSFCFLVVASVVHVFYQHNNIVPRGQLRDWPFYCLNALPSHLGVPFKIICHSVVVQSKPTGSFILGRTDDLMFCPLALETYGTLWRRLDVFHTPLSL